MKNKFTHFSDEEIESLEIVTSSENCLNNNDNYGTISRFWSASLDLRIWLLAAVLTIVPTIVEWIVKSLKSESYTWRDFISSPNALYVVISIVAITLTDAIKVKSYWMRKLLWMCMCGLQFLYAICYACHINMAVTNPDLLDLINTITLLFVIALSLLHYIINILKRMKFF